MPEVVLQDYLEDINQLIEESRLGEAVRHCRAILEQYPRHIDTYRLLGKAYLEQGELQAASDVFHRVLSADPEDFIAHAGMAIVYKQQEQLKEAVWHMQRAFEMDPYNGAIQEALRDLYSKRDGTPEGQLPLSRAALARLHVKGELYSQAIAELRELLQEDPARVDLQALLAEALWRDGQRVDAVEVCQRLLEELPFCIKANAILGEVWMVTDRQDEATEYAERVFDMTLPAHDVLEEDTPAGRLFLAEGAPEIPQQVLVRSLVGTESMDMLGAESDWALDFDMDDADPEWLEALQSGADVSGTEAPVEDVHGDETVSDEIARAEPDSSESEEPVADFTASGGADEADEWPEQQPGAAGEEVEESATRWLGDSLGEFQGLGEAEDETDWAMWLDHEAGSEEPEAASQEQPFSEIEEEGMGATDEFGKGQDEMPEEEMPRQQDEQPVEDAGTESFDWLDELAETDEPAYSEQAFSEDAFSEDAFSEDAFSEDAFLGDVFSEDETAGEAVEMGGDALPDWLVEDAGVFGDLGDAPGDAFDWLGSDQDTGQESVGDVAANPAEDLPDWLSEEDNVPSQLTEAGTDDDLSWLDDLAAGEGSGIEEPPTMSWAEDEEQESLEEPAFDEFLVDADGVDEDSGFIQPAVAEDDEARDAVGEEGIDYVPAEAASDAMDEVPEDLDDAMAWLEQLAAQQGAPVEELPSLSAVSEAPEEEVLEQMPADIGDAMEWLEGLAGGEEVLASAGAIDESAGDEGELDWLEGLSGPVAAGDADFDVVEEPVTPVSAAALEELDDGSTGIDWLEGLGGVADFEEAAAIDAVDDSEPAQEAVTPVSAAELEELDDEESEALDWLDELVSDDVAQEQAAVASEEMAEPGQEIDAPAMDVVAGEGADDAPEDLDDALAWLEQLAARQGAPVDELPSLHSESAIVEEWVQEESVPVSEEPVAEESVSEEPVSEEVMSGEDAGDEDDLDWLGGLEDEEELDDSWLDEITGMDESEEQLQMAGGEEVEASAALAAADDEVPEDLDEAMAWLEQLAARQGAPVDELPSLDEFSVPGETSAMDELEDIPDDPEEALAWLEALAEGETGAEAAIEAGAEIEVVDEPSTPAVPHDVVAARAEAEAILLHDEMDAAAEPSEDEIFADIPEDPDEAMAWLEQLAARQGAPLDELPSVSEPVEEVETPDWIAREAEAETEAETVLPVAEADEEAWVEDESEDLLDELTAELELEDEQLGEAMPDWLGLDDEDAGAVDAIDWNDIEGDVAGWLEAEEEATQHEMVIPAVTAEMDELAPDESDSSEAVWAESAQVAPVAEEAPATEWQQPHIENERLLSARQAVEAGDFDSAVTAYNELLEAGEDLNLLISELEGAVGAQRENSRLRTVLGDAYMRNGQLQKALDAYRQALDSL